MYLNLLDAKTTKETFHGSAHFPLVAKVRMREKRILENWEKENKRKELPDERLRESDYMDLCWRRVKEILERAGEGTKYGSGASEVFQISMRSKVSAAEEIDKLCGKWEKGAA